MDTRDTYCIDPVGYILHQNKENLSDQNNPRVDIVSHTNIGHLTDSGIDHSPSNNVDNKEYNCSLMDRKNDIQGLKIENNLEEYFVHPSLPHNRCFHHQFDWDWNTRILVELRWQKDKGMAKFHCNNSGQRKNDSWNYTQMRVEVSLQWSDWTDCVHLRHLDNPIPNLRTNLVQYIDPFDIDVDLWDRPTVARIQGDFHLLSCRDRRMCHNTNEKEFQFWSMLRSHWTMSMIDRCTGEEVNIRLVFDHHISLRIMFVSFQSTTHLFHFDIGRDHLPFLSHRDKSLVPKNTEIDDVEHEHNSSRSLYASGQVHLFRWDNSRAHLWFEFETNMDSILNIDQSTHSRDNSVDRSERSLTRNCWIEMDDKNDFQPLDVHPSWFQMEWTY